MSDNNHQQVERPPDTGEVETAAVCGNDQTQFTAEEMEEIEKLARDGGAKEATIGGRRVVIVAGLGHRGLALAALAQLAATADVLVVRDDEVLRRDIEQLRPPEIDIKMLEPMVVAEDCDYRGKSNGRKPWQSPHDFRGGKQHKYHQPQRNMKQFMRRRGGR